MDSPTFAEDVASVSSQPAGELEDAKLAAATSRLASTHLVVGAGTLAAFLASGTCMLFHDPPLPGLPLGPHVMFTSRHICILSAALIHLVLGAYVASATTGKTRGIQYAGSLLLLTASILIAFAFVYEPMAGRPATAFSRLGLSGLFVGAILHVGAGLRAREPIGAFDVAERPTRRQRPVA